MARESRFPDIVWYCDQCGACQPSFSESQLEVVGLRGRDVLAQHVAPHGLVSANRGSDRLGGHALLLRHGEVPSVSKHTGWITYVPEGPT